MKLFVFLIAILLLKANFALAASAESEYHTRLQNVEADLSNLPTETLTVRSDLVRAIARSKVGMPEVVTEESDKVIAVMSFGFTKMRYLKLSNGDTCTERYDRNQPLTADHLSYICLDKKGQVTLGKKFYVFPMLR